MFLHFILVQNVFFYTKGMNFYSFKQCLIYFWIPREWNKCTPNPIDIYLLLLKVSGLIVDISHFIVPLGDVRKLSNDKKFWIRPLRNAIDALSSILFFLTAKNVSEKCIESYVTSLKYLPLRNCVCLRMIQKEPM